VTQLCHAYIMRLGDNQSSIDANLGDKQVKFLKVA
jgi:hypothetical protein